MLECGIGGRLDCTNVIDEPECTAITSVGLDHMDLLGDNIEAIAKEKAGIMKLNKPCVVGPDCRHIVAIKEKSRAMQADLVNVERYPTFSQTNDNIAL